MDEGHAKKRWNEVEIYRGELLKGRHQDWCLYKRERMQHLYLAMLNKRKGGLSYCN